MFFHFCIFLIPSANVLHCSGVFWYFYKTKTFSLWVNQLKVIPPPPWIIGPLNYLDFSFQAPGGRLFGIFWVLQRGNFVLGAWGRLFGGGGRFRCHQLPKLALHRFPYFLSLAWGLFFSWLDFSFLYDGIVVIVWCASCVCFFYKREIKLII